MKFKSTHLAALTCAAFLGSTALSRAAVIVSEDFSYGDVALNGQNGGTGFNNAWSSSVNVAGGVVGGNSDSTRNFSTAFPSSGILWVSFDWGHDSSTGSAYGGLTFYVGGSEKFLIGNTWDPSTWNMNGAPAPTGVSSVGIKTGVAKITLGAGATCIVELWVGPIGSPVYVGGAPMATATGRELADVNRIRIMGNNDQKFDNLLIGTTMADVDATDINPYVWTGAANTNFTDPANWVGNAWTQWIDYTFGGTPTNATVTINGTFGIGSLTLQSGLTTDIVIDSTPNPVIMGTDQSGSSATITIAAASSNLTINGSYQASSAVTWDVGAGRTLTLNGPLNNWVDVGTASLVKKGEGTAVLNGASSYNGTTTVTEGTLQIGNCGTTGTLGSGAVTIAGGATLTINRSDNYGTGGGQVFSGAGTIIKEGTGELVFNGGSDHTNVQGINNVVVNNGLIRTDYWGPWNSNLNLTVNGSGKFELWNTSTSLGTLNGDGTVRNTRYFGRNNTTLTIAAGTFAGMLTDSGGNTSLSLIKSGTNTLTLAGTNSYNGLTTIEAGMLVASNNTALGVGGFRGDTMAFIADRATLALQGGISLDEHFHVWGSGVDGLGAVRSLGGNNALTCSYLGAAGYCLRTNSTVGVDVDSLAVSGFYEEGGSFSLTKVGAGTLVLTASTYTGGTTVNAGTLIAGAGGVAKGAVMIASGATLATTSAASTGLAALYYTNDAINQDNIASLPVLLAHFGPNSPVPTLVNTAASMNFAGNGSGFPSPYNSNATNFEAYCSGKLNITTAGTYTFNTSSDDGSMLFIDGQVVVANNAFQPVTTKTGSIALTAGMYDIVIAYNQGGGGYGMNAQISGADNTTMADINTANASITPDLVVGSLAGAGSVSLTTGNLITGIDNSSTNFSGIISGIGSVTKFGTGTQTLAGTNTYAGTTKVNGGTLRIDGDSSGVPNALTVASGAFLGGHGSYGGNITLNDGAGLNCDLTLTDSTLTCGQLSFTNLDFADCTFTVAHGVGYRAYTLIEASSLGTTTFANAGGTIDNAPAKLYISGNKLVLSVGHAPTVISFF